jgi:hypothetical protein
MSTIINPGSSGGGGMAIGGTVTGGTQGSVLFIGAGSVLAQDNANLFWDDTAHILKAGKQIDLQVNGSFVAALYPIYNATADNWFIGEAGNASLTGNGNIAIGVGAGAALTTGNQNVALGLDALPAATSATGNFALGHSALNSLVTGNNNTAIGDSALFNLNGSNGNIVIGQHGLETMTSGGSNICIGDGSNITTGNFNTLIGNWGGPNGAMSFVVALSDGSGALLLDYGFTAANTWSMQNGTSAQTLAVYNTFTSNINYERAIFDWQSTPNVLTIGTQAAGAGVTRGLQFIYGGTNVMDYAVSTGNGRWTFTSTNGFLFNVGGNNKFDFNQSNGGIWTFNVPVQMGQDVAFLFNQHGPTYWATIRGIDDGTSTALEFGRVTIPTNTPTGFIWISSERENLSFGGFNSPSFPALINSGTTLQCMLSDNSAVTDFQAKTVMLAALTVATLPAAGTAGRKAFVTDATSTTFGAAPTGGGTNKVPVFDNGTSWLIG